MSTIQGQIAEYIAFGAILLLLVAFGYVAINAAIFNWRKRRPARIACVSEGGRHRHYRLPPR